VYVSLLEDLLIVNVVNNVDRKFLSLRSKTRKPFLLLQLWRLMSWKKVCLKTILVVFCSAMSYPLAHSTKVSVDSMLELLSCKLPPIEFWQDTHIHVVKTLSSQELQASESLQRYANQIHSPSIPCSACLTAQAQCQGTP